MIPTMITLIGAEREAVRRTPLDARDRRGKQADVSEHYRKRRNRSVWPCPLGDGWPGETTRDWRCLWASSRFH